VKGVVIAMEENSKWSNRDWKWTVSILVSIIVFLLTYKFWGKSESIIDVISIGSGLTSIALAIVAIIIAVSEGIKSQGKEKIVNNGLHSIINNLDTMRNLINKLENDNTKTHNQLNKIGDYISGFKNIEEEIYIGNEKNKGQDKSGITQNNNGSIISRGDIVLANLGLDLGTKKEDLRPVVVIQNDIANKYSPIVTVAPITSQIQTAKLPTQVELKGSQYGLDKDSVILVEQIKVISRERLSQKISRIDRNKMSEIDSAIEIQLGLVDF
jgi:mRNA interferase MazF